MEFNGLVKIVVNSWNFFFGVYRTEKKSFIFIEPKISQNTFVLTKS